MSVGLLMLVLLAPHAAAQDGRMQAPPNPVYIEARVIGEAGEPVAGVRIGAITGAVGKHLRRGMSHGNGPGDSDFSGVSDERGHLRIAVPFAGLRYALGTHMASAYEFDERVSVVASEDNEPVVLRVKLRKPMDPIRVKVVKPDGKDAACLAVTLVGEYGSRFSAVTDDQGNAVFTDVRARYIGQAVLLVEHEQWVAELTIVRWRSDKPTVVKLAEPAGIAGRLVDQQTQHPIAEAQIVVGSRFASGLAWRVKTDARGRFKLGGLPPGSYCYRAVDEQYTDRPPRGDYWHERSVDLVAGEVAWLDGFDMRRRAALRGTVVGFDGEPVAGAMVGYPCHFGSHYDNTDIVYTDDNGAFELRPVGDKSGQVLEAYHPIAGGDRLQMEMFQDGEVRSGITLVTAGTARLRGIVTDEAGEPIPGVTCIYERGSRVSAETDAQGVYDLGRVQLFLHRDNDGPKIGVVQFAPLRPSDSLMSKDGGNWRQPILDDDAGPFYVGTTQTPRMQSADDAALDVTLASTRLLTFTGMVQAEPGPGAVKRTPMAGARLYLLPYRIDLSREIDRRAVQRFIRRYDGQMRGLTSGRHIGGNLEGVDQQNDLSVPRLEMAGQTTTDAQGRWALQVLASDLTTGGIPHVLPQPHAPADAAHDDKPKASVLVVWGDGKRYTLHETIAFDGKTQAFELSMTCDLNAPIDDEDEPMQE